MNQESNPTHTTYNNSQNNNTLWQYLQSLSPETIARLSRPESPEVFQVIENNIINLLGNLSGENFDVSINTSKENLGRLLASATISGYFLRNVEQRMNLEKNLINTEINY